MDDFECTMMIILWHACTHTWSIFRQQACSYYLHADTLLSKMPAKHLANVGIVIGLSSLTLMHFYLMPDLDDICECAACVLKNHVILLNKL